MSVIVGINDVLCGKGQGFMKHPGNKNFREWVKDKVDLYDISDEGTKKRIVEDILGSVEKRGGRFVSLDRQSQNWMVIDRKKARDKTAQALRDCRFKREKKDAHRNDVCGGSPSTQFFSPPLGSAEVEPDVWMDDISNSWHGIGSTSMMLSTEGLSDTFSKVSIVDVSSSIFNSITEDVSPTPRDVLCGSGKGRMNHPGNKDFRRLINDRIKTYNNSDEGSKRKIVEVVIADVERQGGRYLNFDSKGERWYVIDRQKAIDKTAQAFRDLRTKRGKTQPKHDGRESPMSSSSASSSHAVGYEDFTLLVDILMQPDRNDSLGNGISFATMSTSETTSSLSRFSIDMSEMFQSKNNLPVPVFPTTHDVVCGSRQCSMEHPGNQNFRGWVLERVRSYGTGDDASQNRIVDDIIALVEGNGGRFLRLDSAGVCWNVVHPKQVRHKLKRAFQEMSRSQSTAVPWTQHL